MPDCMRCHNRIDGGMRFDVFRIITWKTQDKAKRRIDTNQELVGFEQFYICNCCIDRKIREISNPWSTFIDKFKVTVFTLIIGIALVVSNWMDKNTAFVVGVFLSVYFFVKLARFLSAGYRKKKAFAKGKYSENNIRFMAGWEAVSEVAPRKESNGKGVFFIPVTKATYDMSAEDFSSYYRLTDENARRFHLMLRKYRIPDTPII